MSSNALRRFFVRRPWLPRLALGVILSLLGFEVVYVAAANTILGTRALDRWVTGATPGLSLEIDSGWTLWPGRVHVRRLELHFEDYNLQFSVSLDAAVVDLRLWQLPAKTFHLTRVRAEGVRFLFRHKVANAEGLERRLALYPKIAGFSDPPLLAGAKRPPRTDAQYNLWTIQLEDVDARVKELWFLEYRFTGTGRAKGGFRLQPERDARTDWCSLTLDGALRVGEQTVASRLSGHLEAKLDRHDPRVVQGAQIFTKISFDTDLRAAILGLEPTELYARAEGPHLSRGMGALRVRAKLGHGAWMKTTELHYDTAGATFSQGHLIVAGALGLSVDLIKGGTDAVFELSASSPRLKLSFKGSPKALDGPSVRDAHLTAEVSASLTGEMRQTSLDAEVKAEVPDLGWLNHALSSKALLTGGSGRASATLAWAEGNDAKIQTALEVKNAGFNLGKQAMLVSGSAGAVVKYDHTTKRGYVSRLELELPQLAALVKNAWTPLPGGLQVHAERLSWQGLPPSRSRARFELRSETIAPWVPLVIPSAFSRMIAMALVRLGKTHAIVELDRTPAALVLRLEEFQSGDVRATGILRDQTDREHPCGRFFVSSSKLSVGIVLYGGATSVSPFVSGKWWRERPPTENCGPEFANDRKSFAGSPRNPRPKAPERH
jgi:hypothetical protein